jgi:hypothetical protein
LNATGAIIVAAFAILWVAAGTRQLGRVWFASLLLLALLISGLLIFAAGFIPYAARGGRFDGNIYGIFVALEAIAIVIAVVLLNRIRRKQYLIPIIAFIVGAHFFGMVPALHSNDFWWVGGAMCVLPLLTMSILPHKFWAPVVGIGCALILWLSALRAFF